MSVAILSIVLILIVLISIILIYNRNDLGGKNVDENSQENDENDNTNNGNKNGTNTSNDTSNDTNNETPTLKNYIFNYSNTLEALPAGCDVLITRAVVSGMKTVAGYTIIPRNGIEIKIETNVSHPRMRVDKLVLVFGNIAEVSTSTSNMYTRSLYLYTEGPCRFEKITDESYRLRQTSIVSDYKFKDYFMIGFSKSSIQFTPSNTIDFLFSVIPTQTNVPYPKYDFQFKDGNSNIYVNSSNVFDLSVTKKTDGIYRLAARNDSEAYVDIKLKEREVNDLFPLDKMSIVAASGFNLSRTNSSAFKIARNS